MAGFSDLPFRTIAKDFCAGLTYTEMVSAKALYYGDKKTQRLLVPEDDACAVQIFGAEPDIMAFAAKQLQEWGAPMIDINMGCPAPKIVNNGEGSALIKKMDLAERIVATIANCKQDKAKEILVNNNYKLKEAILEIKYNINTQTAEKLLLENNGILRKIFNKYS